MGVISKLWAALGNLAAGLDGLAATVRAADARLRQQLALDGPEPPAEVIDQPAALPEPNGRRKARA